MTRRKTGPTTLALARLAAVSALVAVILIRFWLADAVGRLDAMSHRQAVGAITSPTAAMAVTATPMGQGDQPAPQFSADESSTRVGPTSEPTRTCTVTPTPTPSPHLVLVEKEAWAAFSPALQALDAAMPNLELALSSVTDDPKRLTAPMLQMRWDGADVGQVLRREPYYAAFHVANPMTHVSAETLEALLSGSSDLRLVCGDGGRNAAAIAATYVATDVDAEALLLPSWAAAKEYVATHRDAWALLPWPALDHRVSVAPISDDEAGALDALGAGALTRSLCLVGAESLPEPLVQALAAGLGQDAPTAVELVAVGDIMLDRYVGQLIEAHGADYVFDGDGVRDMLVGADVAFGNLECPISERGTRQDKGYEFRASPKVVEGLVNAGFDVLCLANNHTGDYGDVALLDTLDLLSEAGLATVGAGRTITEAHAATLVTRNGLDMAFLAYNEILPSWFEAQVDSPGSAFIDQETMVAAVKAATDQADLVIVSCHWGVEYSATPNSRQRRWGEALAKAGADLVIGHHPHVVQGLDYQQDTLITYSLGNFVFDQGFSTATSQGAALWCLLDASGVRIARLIPYEIVRCQPSLLSGENGTAVTQHMLTVTANTQRLPRTQ